MNELEAKLLGYALAALAAAGLLWGFVSHERTLGAAREHSARVQEQQAAKQAAAVHDATTRATQKEVSDEAQRMQARADADSLDRARAAGRLLDAARAAGHRAAACAASGSSPASAPDVVPADLFRRSLDALGELAEFADRARIAGDACERAYGALSP